MFNSPLFILSSDVDWASEACIEDLAETASEFGIKPVFMATGKSAALDRLHTSGEIELGLHPNFLPHSDHGSDVASVVAYMHALYPNATTFRSHSFVDSTPISNAMRALGMQYDSNLCLYLQPDIVPLQHCSGLMRFPVFWEDDVHWNMNDSNWDLDNYIAQFMSPGLKVINVHPISFALNIPNAGFYQSNKSECKTYDRVGLERRRYQGRGTRTFLIHLFKRIRDAGMRFYTLGEAYRLCINQVAEDKVAGRTDHLSEADHQRYWASDNESKQKELKELYNKRNAADPYATSRDFHLRELEIEAIRRFVPRSGKIIDLGCGNGYTLVSLARQAHQGEMIGIDFSEELIGGADTLLKREAVPLTNPPKFACADAVRYLREQPDGSAEVIITERFLLNMPDTKTQKVIIADAYRVLKKGGRLIMCEGSNDGFDALNALRKEVGLSVVPATSADNLSAIRFDDSEIENFVKGLGFSLTEKLGFSAYFMISRTLHPLLIAPQEPSFSARINELARRIQLASPFSPQLGANVVWVLVR